MSRNSIHASGVECDRLTTYYEEPNTVAELLARYREVKRRLYPGASPAAPCELTVQDAESIFTFVLAVAAVMAERVRQSERQAAETRRRGGVESPGSKARGAVRAVSKRTGVSVDDILGRQRINVIASARHEAIWRVRQVTEWSLPRVGHFFAQRDHTTVLHSIRRMEDRAARDPDLRAYMAGIERACFAQRRSLTPLDRPSSRLGAAASGRARRVR